MIDHLSPQQSPSTAYQKPTGTANLTEHSRSSKGPASAATTKCCYLTESWGIRARTAKTWTRDNGASEQHKNASHHHLRSTATTEDVQKAGRRPQVTKGPKYYRSPATRPEAVHSRHSAMLRPTATDQRVGQFWIRMRDET